MPVIQHTVMEVVCIECFTTMNEANMCVRLSYYIIVRIKNIPPPRSVIIPTHING